jgi:hypothetical protein
MAKRKGARGDLDADEDLIEGGGIPDDDGMVYLRRSKESANAESPKVEGAERRMERRKPRRRRDAS